MQCRQSPHYFSACKYVCAQVLDETLQDPDCNRAQLAAALMKMDPELPEAQASHFADLMLRFSPGQESDRPDTAEMLRMQS